LIKNRAIFEGNRVILICVDKNLISLFYNIFRLSVRSISSAPHRSHYCRCDIW